MAGRPKIEDKAAPVTAYLSSDLRADLKAAATEERRSDSQMAAVLIEEALAARKGKAS